MIYVVLNAPISNVVSQPHITESYRRTSAKGLVPLEVELESTMNKLTGYFMKMKHLTLRVTQVIRARAKEVVKRAKDGLETGFSRQGHGQYSTAPIDDVGDLDIDRKKIPVVDCTLGLHLMTNLDASNFCSCFLGYFILQIK